MPVFPRASSHHGTIEIDLERDGPHVLIGGTAGTGKSELLRTLVMGLAAGLPPDAITFALIDLAGGSTFGACAALPHVVMHHDTSDAHLAERTLRCLRAELLARDQRAWRGFTLPRFVIVVDEPAVAIGHPHLVSSLLEIAADGERLGVHLIVATERPARVLDNANALTIGVRIALHLTDERESEVMIGTRNATRVPLRIPGRGLIRVRDDEPIEFHAAMVSASSSASDGHDLELRPYVVGRELTPMELRVTRGTNGNVGTAGSTAQNDLARSRTRDRGGRRDGRAGRDRGVSVRIPFPTSSTVGGSARIGPRVVCRSPWSTCPTNCARRSGGGSLESTAAC